jgi:uncharacterized protein
MRRALIALFLLLPGSGLAQSWPEHREPFVNDQAGIIDQAAEARLRRDLETLHAETGVEAVILTLLTRAAYQTDADIETFARGLFAVWDIGAPGMENGILILVAKDDREMRIQLGLDYENFFSTTASNIITHAFLPAFRAGRFSLGIEAGTLAVIDEIARKRFP